MMVRTGVEQQFTDSRLPPDERIVLESAMGYGLPALTPGAEWVGTEQVDWNALRGTVLVIQSYTRADEDGRAALRRTQDVLKQVQGDGFKLIALHTPDEVKAAADFFAKKPPETPTILDTTGAYCDELGVYTRPVTIMVDRMGRIRYVGVPLAKLKPALELLVKEPFDAASAPPPVLTPRDSRVPEGDAGAAPAAPSADPVAFPPFSNPVGSARDVRGNPGPKLDGLKFLTRKPETEGRVVMVEFWATWCGPCVKNIPHLNELHKMFRDTVAIIGVSDEEADVVKEFMGRKNMDYAVALDRSASIKGSLAVRGIPHAIIMSPDGVVRWQGHPAGLDVLTLQQIVAASAAQAGPAGPKRWVKAN